MKGKWNKNIKSLKRSKTEFHPFCDKKIQEYEEQDYLSLKGSKSVSDPNNEEEIKVQYVTPIGGILYHPSI